MRGARSRWQGFLGDEDGAVTVDWVVLTGGIIVLVIAVVALVLPAPKRVAQQTGTVLTNAAPTVQVVTFN